MAVRLAVSSNGHHIEVVCSSWSGKETVYYDGSVISEKRDFGQMGFHTFNVQEDGDHISYEVQVCSGSGGIKIAVRRNGILISHN